MGGKMSKWTIIYTNEHGRKGETIIEAEDYENAVIEFEYQYPNCRALLLQKH